MSQDIVERLNEHARHAHDGLRAVPAADLREAASVITTLTAERDATNKTLQAAFGDDTAALLARVLAAEALVQSMREALENIRELNFSGADENGNQWANSDLIDQEITAALSRSEV